MTFATLECVITRSNSQHKTAHNGPSISQTQVQCFAITTRMVSKIDRQCFWDSAAVFKLVKVLYMIEIRLQLISEGLVTVASECGNKKRVPPDKRKNFKNQIASFHILKLNALL